MLKKRVVHQMCSESVPETYTSEQIFMQCSDTVPTSRLAAPIVNGMVATFGVCASVVRGPETHFDLLALFTVALPGVSVVGSVVPMQV